MGDWFDEEQFDVNEQQECECQDCHELFMGFAGEHLCAKCARKQIVEEDEA